VAIQFRHQSMSATLCGLGLAAFHWAAVGLRGASSGTTQYVLKNLCGSKTLVWKARPNDWAAVVSSSSSLVM